MRYKIRSQIIRPWKFQLQFSILNTVEAAYMGRLGTGYSCLLYPLSLLSVVQLIGPGRTEDRIMRAN